MSFKEKFAKYYAESYFKRYGDRLTNIQGNVLSCKIKEVNILWIFHKIVVTLLIRPDRSRNVVRCIYKRSRWFKKPTFMAISQGHYVAIQGLNGKKSKKGSEIKEAVTILNVRNLSTKKDLIPMDGKVKVQRQVQRIK